MGLSSMKAPQSLSGTQQHQTLFKAPSSALRAPLPRSRGEGNIDKRSYLEECEILVIYLEGLAERQGFEPWEGCPSTVFKTAAFDRSAISPSEIISQPPFVCKQFFI